MNKVTPKEIYDYLREKDISHTHSLGILVNIQGESNFDAGVQEVGVKRGRGGFGLFQHTGPRRYGLEYYARSKGKPASDWKMQVDYALSEPDTLRYLSYIFRDAEEAAIWWTVHWERPRNAKTQAAKRIRFLHKLEQLIV